MNNKSTNYYIQRGFIEEKDNARFRTILEVSDLFNKGYKGMQRCYFKDGVGNSVWCPILKLEYDDCKNINYDNELSSDEMYIFETSKINNEEFINKVINSREKRSVFAKCKDENGNKTYKFIGVYQLDREKTIEIRKRSWKKIDNYINISIYF